MEDRVGLLRKTSLFGHLPREDLDRLAGLLKSRSDRTRSTIYREGDPDSSFYLVASGRLKVWTRDEKGHRRVLNYLQAGDSFGSHSLLTGERRDVTVDVEEAAVLLYLEKRDFDGLIERHPDLREALSLHAMERLGEVPVLSKLSADDLQRIAATMGRASYRQGSTIYHQGELSNTFYIVESGHIVLLADDGQGDDQPLAQLFAGDFFGERSLLTGRPRETSVHATEDTRLFYLNKKDFDRLVKDLPSVRKALGLEADARELMLHKRFPWQREGEVLISLTRKHPYAFVRSLWVLVFPLVCLAAILALARALDWSAVWAYAACALVAAGAVGLVFWLWLDWRNDHYIVTNKRVVHLEKTILLHESRDEAPLENIQDISIVMPSVVGRLLGFNDLGIQTAGAKGQVIFRTVGNASWIRDKLFDQLERIKAGDQVGQRDAIRRRLQMELGRVEEEAPLPLDDEQRRRAVASSIPPSGQPEETPMRHPLSALRAYLIPRMRTEEHGVVTWRKHWFRLVDRAAGPAILLLILVQLAIAATMGLAAPPPRFEGLFWGALLFGIPLALFLVWFRYEDWRNDVYQLTDDRIIDVEKLPLGLREERKEARLSMIQDIGYEIPGPIANLLDYGNVVIETAGREAVFTFSWVHQPRRVQEEVFARMDAFREGERQRQRESRSDELLDWFTTYSDLAREEGDTPDEESE
jgi:CRP-like cAMP-binding protein/membrane protein YdbS with pleckstrin-like domain